MLHARFIFFSILFTEIVYGISSSTCGFNSCNKAKPGFLNVHLVPHSHDDVGWLKTVEQYYYGLRTDIQQAGVQYILDSVIHALEENKERRFVQVETAFFHQWWMLQNEETREKVKNMVNTGQFQFLGGGWSMNDEAAAHYISIIDQFTLGLSFLNETFGECGRPNIGWQIDPFGHSKQMATIFAEMKYQGLFFSRLDWRDKTTRTLSKTMEMIWQGSQSLGSDSNLFTSVLYNHYSAPPGFCFDILCKDPAIVDDEANDEFNQESRVINFATFLRGQADHFLTNNIILTMGDDFNYQNALQNYRNLDRLIKGFQKYPQKYNELEMNVFYSTPSCYVKAVNEEANSRKLSFPVKTDDFFPYSSDYNSYWAGYFTSRPTSKRFERQANNLLQIYKQLASQSNLKDSAYFILQKAVGIMQHHDAITGTEKQHVADDYAKILSEALDFSTGDVNAIISTMLSKNPQKIHNLKFKNCILSNVSICDESSENKFLVSVYNPLSRPVDYYVRLPVDSPNFDITGSNDENVPYQVSLAIDKFEYMNDSRVAPYELVFLAEQVPALGLKLFFVKKVLVKEASLGIQEDTTNQKYLIGNGENGALIDPTLGTLKSIIVNGGEIQVKQNLMFYLASVGDNMVFDERSSGAYIFRPSKYKPNATELPLKEFKTFKGPLYDEVHQTFDNWAKQVIRHYHTKKYVEIEWLLGPIPLLKNLVGLEIVSRVSTFLKSGDVFYTDSNGKEMVRRVRNFQETYPFSLEEPIAGNYYPVGSKISIEDPDEGIRVSLINDRAQGGSSLQSGEMELMMHRRLTFDDAFGVGEALNEKQYGIGLVARGKHYLTVVGEGLGTKVEEKELVEEIATSPWVFVSTVNRRISKKRLSEFINFEISGLKKKVPQNIKILTLEPHPGQKNAIILRLEHLYEVRDNIPLSEDASIDLEGLFTMFNIISLRETNLAADRYLEEVETMRWRVAKNLRESNYAETDYIGFPFYNTTNYIQDPKNFVVYLYPTEIRTFIMNVEYIL